MRIVIAVLMCTSAFARAKEPASIDDLKVLLQHEAYAELLDRAEDIAPAARGESWREIVTSAAAGAVEHAPVAKDPFAESREADRLRARYAFVETRAVFVNARDEAVLKGLQRCIHLDDSTCFDLFTPYEKTLGVTGSLKAGKMLRRNGAVPYRAMELFARAAGSKDAAACKDADVADAVNASLDLPPEYDAAKAARKVAFDWCWSALQDSLKSKMKSASSARLQNACAPMRAKKALTSLQEELCKDEERDAR